MFEKITKKGQQISLGGISGIVALLVVAVLIATYAGSIVTDVKDNFASDEGRQNCGTGVGTNCTSAAFNLSNNAEGGLVNLSGQFGNVGTVVAAGLIIGVLVASFVVFGTGKVSFR